MRVMPVSTQLTTTKVSNTSIRHLRYLKFAVIPFLDVGGIIETSETADALFTLCWGYDSSYKMIINYRNLRLPRTRLSFCAYSLEYETKIFLLNGPYPTFFYPMFANFLHTQSDIHLPKKFTFGRNYQGRNVGFQLGELAIFPRLTKLAKLARLPRMVRLAR